MTFKDSNGREVAVGDIVNGKCLGTDYGTIPFTITHVDPFFIRAVCDLGSRKVVPMSFCNQACCTVAVVQSANDPPTLPTMPAAAPVDGLDGLAAWLPEGYVAPESFNIAPLKKNGATCSGKGCPEPHNPWAEPNQPDGSYLCFACRSR